MGLFRKRRARPEPPGPPTRLHIGCGQQSIPGWINIDNQGLPGVDQVLDVRKGLPFANVAAIYAEHFLEHLGLEDGLAFLVECRRVLRPDGVLRLSTPNLDWVLLTHYRGPQAGDDDAREDAIRLNRAFHGWGHQFLYNRAMLASAVKSAGFARGSFCPYGESDVPQLKGLERHETWEDTRPGRRKPRRFRRVFSGSSARRSARNRFPVRVSGPAALAADPDPAP
jgi:predicted SAM-dependent methyltransferase